MGVLRRIRQMFFPPAGYQVFRWLRKADMTNAGELMENSIVAATLLWMARTFPEAPPMLENIEPSTGQEVAVRIHPALRLLRKPNEYYTGSILWMATVIDYVANGDAYWLKVRSMSDDVIQLWYAPSWTMCPQGNDREFVAYYDYTVPGGETKKIRPEDVVHFQYGIDPYDNRRGYSPLRAVLSEIFTDNEAVEFTASILKNMGVPGILFSPDGNSSIDEDEAKQTKADFSARFTGGRRGEPLVMTGPTKVSQFGFSPEQLVLSEIRQVPEERVTAVTGIPAVVVGLGAGLKRSTFTNMGEARVAAYEAGLIPTQRTMGEDITFQLLPDFVDDPFMWRFTFDYAKVRCLQEDLYRLAQRESMLYERGVQMRSESRRKVGLPVDATRDDVFVLPLNQSLIHGSTGEITAAPRALPPAGGNGNGQAYGYDPQEIADAVVNSIERRELTEGTNGR